MWLNNYIFIKRAAALIVEGVYLGKGNNPVLLDGVVKQIDGTVRTQLHYNISNPLYTHGVLSHLFDTGEASNKFAYYPVIGCGNTAVDAGDFSLAQRIESGYNLAANSAVYDPSNNSVKASITIECSAADGLTISEIGIQKQANISNSGLADFLMYREVLAEPVVLALGETATITFSLPL